MQNQQKFPVAFQTFNQYFCAGTLLKWYYNIIACYVCLQTGDTTGPVLGIHNIWF